MKRVVFVVILLGVMVAGVHAARPEHRGPFPSLVTLLKEPNQFIEELGWYLRGYPLQTVAHADGTSDVIETNLRTFRVNAEADIAGDSEKKSRD